VRLPIVVKTGKPELGQRHRFHDKRECIVHRIPLFYQGSIIGGLGIILFDDLGYLHEVTTETHMIKALKVNKPNKVGDVYKSRYTFDDILTQSPAGNAIKDKARAYAETDFSVLITGESGVGKELFAHALHAAGKRKDGPFIRVNCAAIPESLIESELFGYGQGAFTGAVKGGKIGKFELANGGTIFLDEIGDFPLPLQAKLLRILQEKELEKIGSNEIVLLDIRIIAATNGDLEQKVRENKFRADLFYRLNVLNLYIPSLRERKEDIPLLINHFVTLMYQEFNILKVFPEIVVKILQEYPWQGNIRELKNMVERIAVNSPEQIVTKADIPPNILAHVKKESKAESKAVSEAKPPPAAAPPETSNLNETMAMMEREIILEALKKHGNNKAKTAAALGIPRMSLYRKLREFEV